MTETDNEYNKNITTLFLGDHLETLRKALSSKVTTEVTEARRHVSVECPPCYMGLRFLAIISFLDVEIELPLKPSVLSANFWEAMSHPRYERDE